MQNLEVQGVKVPVLGYGTWKLEGAGCIEGVRTALGMGYRHIDTAQIYGNEAEVGQGIKTSGVPRDRIFLTTKVWMDKVRDGDLQRSVEDSLRKLQTDHVDLMLIHWPVKDVPLDEQMKALSQVKAEGKARLIGVSNFTVALMQEAREALGAPIANNQVEYHPFLSQKPVLDYIRTSDMFLTAYSPVARGKVLENQQLKDIGAKYGKSAAQVTLRWLVQQGSVAAIPKAAKAENAQANIEIFDFALTDAEMAEIFALGCPEGRMISPDWSPDWDKGA